MTSPSTSDPAIAETDLDGTGGAPALVDEPQADVAGRAGTDGRGPDHDDEDDEHIPSATRVAVEWVLVIAGAIAVALVIKSFVLAAFFIPSGSMLPTLQVGDRVLVNRLSYKLHDINRGDVVVFERPDGDQNDDVKDLIKRVIALPGESLVIEDHKVFIDGQALDEPYLPAGVTTEATGTWTHRCTRADPCVVPAGTVWVMGDNRGDSRDSRYLGPIPQDKVVGRAFTIVWPLSDAGGL